MDVDEPPVSSPSSSLLPTLAEAARQVEQQQPSAAEEEHGHATMDAEAASQPSDTEPFDITDGGRSQSVASAEEALAEHDYAHHEGFPPRDSDSDGFEKDEPSEGDVSEDENQPVSGDAN